MNSNFAVYKDHSIHNRSNNNKSETNEHDNTTPFNFSSDHSKINHLSIEETKV